MLGEIGGGFRLADASGSRGQRKIEFWSLNEEAPGQGFAADNRFCKFCFRRDQSVIVVGFVGEGKRAASVRLRLALERDGRSAVGDGGDIEARNLRAVTLQNEFRVRAQNQPRLRIVRCARNARRGCGFGRRRIAIGGFFRRLQAASRLDLDIRCVGRPNHNDRAHRRLQAAGIACAVLRTQIVAQLQDNRRLSGVGGRIDPGIQPITLRKGSGSAPVESRENTGVFFRPCKKGARDDAKNRQCAQRVMIALHKARRWRGDAKRMGSRQRALLVQAPKHICRAIRARICKLVVERSRGRMGYSGIAVNAGKALRARRSCQAAQR